MTGEDWNLIMDDLANTSNCKDSQTYDEMQVDGVQGCGSWYSYLYFISYMIILQMIIINLTVAAVIDGLSSARKDNTGIIKKDEITDLIDLWAEYDPKATGWIEVTNLVFLLFELPKPIGCGMDRTLLQIKRRKIDNEDKDIDDILAETHKKREIFKANKNNKVNLKDDKSLSNFDEHDENMRLRKIETIREKEQSANFLIQDERKLCLK